MLALLSTSAVERNSAPRYKQICWALGSCPERKLFFETCSLSKCTKKIFLRKDKIVVYHLGNRSKQAWPPNHARAPQNHRVRVFYTHRH